MQSKTLYIVRAGVICALYVVLTFISNLFGLSSGVIQLRLSECLCVLPIFMPEAVPGLFVGCILANALTGAVVYDVIFGSLTTLAAAVLTRLLRKVKGVNLLPPIILNGLLIPLILIYVYNIKDAYWLLALSIGAGEALSAGALGAFIIPVIKRILSKAQES